MGDWKDQTGLPESTKVAKIYVHKDTREEWKQEAEDRELGLSTHLRYTIQKARHLREKGRFNITPANPDPDRVEDRDIRVEDCVSTNSSRHGSVGS